MYNLKISEDLIPIIYRQSKLTDKTMAKYIDDLIRPLLIENKDIKIDENKNNKEKINDNEKRKDNRKGNDNVKDFIGINNIDIDEIMYCCGSCRKQICETDGETGFCEFCECEVFVEKI